MRKVIFLFFLVCISAYSYASNHSKVPSKYLIGIKTFVDEFNGDTLYSNKTPLSIVKNDSLTLYLTISYVSDAQQKYDNVQLLIDNEIFTLDNEIKEKPTTKEYLTRTFALFSSYRAISTNMKDAYLYECKLTNSIELAERLANCKKFKVKFNGENPVILSYEYSVPLNMKRMFKLYTYLKNR